MSKRQRVEATLNLQPVDRVGILEQLSFNPGVIAMYTGKDIQGFEYTIEDIGAVVRKTTDITMPPHAPRGKEKITTEDGFVVQNDNWTAWTVSHPFDDEVSARDYLIKKTEKLRNTPFDPESAREEYCRSMLEMQKLVGETVILNFSNTGMCGAFSSMGLEIFTFFYSDFPEVMDEYMTVSVANEIRRIHAVADRDLSPVILIPEDFATKQGPIFPPDFLDRHHHQPIRKLVDAWHEHGIKILFHSDGNYRKSIPALLDCDVDGFYCLELNCGMDIVELKREYPQVTWAGGVDGIDLMERGTPQQVRKEVQRHIIETNALETGGMFVASSSEINPPIKPENFRAMVEATETSKVLLQ